jgi:hypothetical protein
MIKKVLKYIGIVVLFIILLFIFIANFSSVESKLECVGEISSENIPTPTTLYIELSEYRPWVGLWSDSDGSINLEIPNQHVGYYSQIEESGNQLQIFDKYPTKELKGNFSKLSKTLALQIDFYGFFDGSCNEI